MPESDFKYTSIRMHKKTNSLLEEIREVEGCSMNSLVCAMLDKYARLLLLNRDTSIFKHRTALKEDVQQILSEVDQ